VLDRPAEDRIAGVPSWTGALPAARMASSFCAAVEERIEELLVPFARAVAVLDDIPGVGPTAAHAIIAEIGVDMTRFPTAAHLASWAKFAPGVNESAGKNKGNARPDTAIAT
jgi:transposase